MLTAGEATEAERPGRCGVAQAAPDPVHGQRPAAPGPVQHARVRVRRRHSTPAPHQGART